MSFWDEKEAKRLFKELSFYMQFIEKPYIKRYNDIDVLCKRPFYNELNIVKTSKAFKRYAKSYSIEIIDSKDSSVQFTISKPSIKDLLKDLLKEISKVLNIK